MDNLLFVFIITLSLTVLFTTPMLFFYKRLIKRKNLQLQDMGKKIKDLRGQLDKNRRRAIRIDIPREHCKFQLVDVDDPTLARLRNRTGVGDIKDISTKGLRLVCDYDLPIKKAIFLKIHFQLRNESFDFKGKIVRKGAHIGSSQVTYGVEFTDNLPAEEGRLAQNINKIQIELCRTTA